MAKKNNKEKKPEIEEEKEQKQEAKKSDEVELEDLVEAEEETEEENNIDDNRFVEFFTDGGMPVPVLGSSSESQKVPELETTAEQAPAATEAQEEKSYMTVYNAPDYMETEMPAIKEMRERQVITSAQDIRRHATDTEHLRPVRVESWHEMHNLPDRHEGYEVVAKAERIEEERKLPFQQEKKYKEKRG